MFLHLSDNGCLPMAHWGTLYTGLSYTYEINWLSLYMCWILIQYPNIYIDPVTYHVSLEIRQDLILIIAPKTHSGLFSRDVLFFIFHVQQSTFIQIQPCHLLLAAAQWWRVGFHLTGAYFWGRAYIMSILKKIFIGLIFRLVLIFGETGYYDI